jgi:ethanolamine permease
MIDSEVTSTVAAAGGQYAQAKHIVGPLMAFNVGLFLVLAYTMLEAGNAITIGFLLDTVANMFGHEGLNQRPFIILTVLFLAWLNYRGVLATLNFSFVITAIAFLAIVILFLAVQFGVSAIPLDFTAITNEPLPYGWVGILASLHFGLWYYLGIEGTTQAAEEVRSPPRSLPYGTMAGIITLVIAATLTWYVCSGLIPWEYLGQAGTPLFDAARVTGSTGLMVLLFIGTIFSTLASANGCINDASRAWFSMGRDRYLPIWFGAVHPTYRTPYRSIVFLVPIALIFALGAPLDQVITFSILSGLLGYTFMSFNMVMFRRKWPLGSIKRGYVHPFHPLPAMVLLLLCAATYVAIFLGYGTQLIAMMCYFILASLWFHFWRYRFVRRGDQFTMPWPRPQGY